VACGPSGASCKLPVASCRLQVAGWQLPVGRLQTVDRFQVVAISFAEKLHVKIIKTQQRFVTSV